MSDMWDEPVDLDSVPDWDAAPPPPPPPPPTVPPAPAWTPPPRDDDETAFWRDVREASDHPNTKADKGMSTTPFAEWIAEQRRVAFTVPCTVCKVLAGQPCIRVSGNPPKPVYPPEPIRKYPAHAPRIRDARRKLTA